MADVIIKKTTVDVPALIRFIERTLSDERTIQEVNALLNNDISYLCRDYEHTQAEILLSFLRRAAA